jgi:hypothetical protein
LRICEAEKFQGLEFWFVFMTRKVGASGERRRSNVELVIVASVRIIHGIASLDMGHQLTEQAVMRVVLQYGVGASKLRLQAQQLVAGFLADYTGVANLGTVVVPDFQSRLGFFE